MGSPNHLSPVHLPSTPLYLLMTPQSHRMMWQFYVEQNLRPWIQVLHMSALGFVAVQVFTFFLAKLCVLVIRFF
jgi:hypothetical protein